MEEVTFRTAESAHLALLAELMTAFNQEHGSPCDPGRTAELLVRFLAQPELGCAWLVFHGDALAGYLVLCHGFSFEHGGRDAWVDEIYVRPECRRRGLARAMLRHATGHCAAEGIGALHLEVAEGNLAARRLYAEAGFTGAGRLLLTWKAA